MSLCTSAAAESGLVTLMTCTIVVAARAAFGPKTTKEEKIKRPTKAAPAIIVFIKSIFKNSKF
jgi:hypothetical protein